MMSHTLSVPYIRDESHADGSVYGGVEPPTGPSPARSWASPSPSSARSA